MNQVVAQAVEPGIPEGFLPVQPFERARQRPALQPTIHDAADLAARDETRVFEDAQMLDEAGQRHSEGIRQLSDRAFPLPQSCKHGTARGIGQRAEYGIEPNGTIVNHMVNFTENVLPCQV